MAVVGKEMLPLYRLLLAHEFVETSTAKKKEKKTNQTEKECNVLFMISTINCRCAVPIHFFSVSKDFESHLQTMNFTELSPTWYRFSQVAIAISCVLCNVLLDLFIYIKNKTCSFLTFIDDMVEAIP